MTRRNEIRLMKIEAYLNVGCYAMITKFKIRLHHVFMH